MPFFLVIPKSASSTFDQLSVLYFLPPLSFCFLCHFTFRQSPCVAVACIHPPLFCSLCLILLLFTPPPSLWFSLNSLLPLTLLAGSCFKVMLHDSPPPLPLLLPSFLFQYWRLNLEPSAGTGALPLTPADLCLCLFLYTVSSPFYLLFFFSLPIIYIIVLPKERPCYQGVKIPVADTYVSTRAMTIHEEPSLPWGRPLKCSFCMELLTSMDMFLRQPLSSIMILSQWDLWILRLVPIT